MDVVATLDLLTHGSKVDWELDVVVILWHVVRIHRLHEGPRIFVGLELVENELHCAVEIVDWLFELLGCREELEPWDLFVH